MNDRNRKKVLMIPVLADGAPDLFGDRPHFRQRPRKLLQTSPELIRARALCRQLHRVRAPADKQRVAHLICLNLKAMLQRPAVR